MTDNEPNTPKNTFAIKRVNTRSSLRKGLEEMHRNIFARIIRLVIGAVIVTTCLGVASVMVMNSAVPVAGVSHPTPWP
jgi:hypothetical protein